MRVRIVSALLLTLAAAPALAEDPPTRLWVQTWNSPANHEDIGRLLAVDSPDRIYVGASTYEGGTGGNLYDFLLLQYNASGGLVWERRYGDTNGDMISDLVVPSAGEVVVTGFSFGPSGAEVVTVKYDQAGNLLWDRRFPLQNLTAPDFGPQISIDGDRNVVVGSSTGDDFLVLKYAPDGMLLWSRTHDGPGDGLDIETDIAVGVDGSVYVTGTADNESAFMTVKFSASGSFQWEQLESGDIGSVFAPSKVAVGPDGDVVVAGNPESTCGVFQFKVWKCSAATGAVLWSDTAPSAPCSSFIFHDMSLDNAGNVLVACDGSESGVDIHMQVLRYSPDGLRQWIREFDGPGSAEDVASAIATDAVGAAYIFGYTTFPPQNRDYAAAKFSADGVQQWTVGWASDQGTNDIGRDIVVDQSGEVVVTGNSYSPVTNEDVVTIRYHQASAAAAPGAIAVGSAHLYLSAAPNPTMRATGIHYEIGRDGPARLAVLTAGGREIRRLVDAAVPKGAHRVDWDGMDGHGRRVPAGIYIVALEAGGVRSTAKVSLLP